MPSGDKEEKEEERKNGSGNETKHAFSKVLAIYIQVQGNFSPSNKVVIPSLEPVLYPYLTVYFSDAPL